MSFSIRKDGIFDPEGKYPNPLTGQPYSPQYKVHAIKDGIINKGWSQLDAWKARVDIIKKIHQNQLLLLVLPTGVGKTVIVPNLLLHYFEYKKRVVVTVPRLTITSENGEWAAKRMDVPLYKVNDKGEDIINENAKDKENNRYRTNSKIVGYKYGEVGTQFGDDNSILLFTTDGNIKQKIVGGDKDLSNYGGIIIDEAHERSVNIDVLIALVMDILPRRPDFKVIIMSATIKKETFTNYFKRIGLGDKYSTFSLDEIKTSYRITYQPTMKNINSSRIVDEVYKKINEIILDPKLPAGNILAFVTSESETAKIKRQIDNNMSKYAINNKPYTIVFTKAIIENDKNIAVGKVKLIDIKPTPNAPQGFSRKVIIATNAVESSVTFKEPMVYVIDTGLAFEKKYDAKNYAYDTGKNLVSQASIKQRCGRTGRTCDGFCIQLYTTDQFNKLSVYTTPKILVEEFTGELLKLAVINGNIPNAFKFMSRMIEEPSTYKEIISRAYHNLLNMDLIDDAGNVTNLGHVCNKFNDVKIAKMIIGGYYMGCMNWSIMLGAILIACESFENIFHKPPFIDENPKLEYEYKQKIKSFVNENGDHISLLIIFNNFISVPANNRYKYSEANGLDYKTLSRIQKEYDNLVKTVTQQIPYIKNLNLFNVPPEVLIFGGGLDDNNNDDSDDDSDDSDISDGDGDDIDKELQKDENEFEEYINNIKGGGSTGNGGSGKSSGGGSSCGGSSDNDNSNGDEDDSNEDDSNEDDSDDSDDDLDDTLDYEDEYKDIEISNKQIEKINNEYNKYNKNKTNTTNIFNTNISSRLSNTNISNTLSNDSRTNGDNYHRDFQSSNITHYPSNDKHPRHSKHTRKLTIKNRGKGGKQSSQKGKHKYTKKQPTQHIRKSVGGGSVDKDIDKDKLKKRRAIMDLLDIKNLKQLNITPSSSLIDRILTSLFFGYSNNIACYSGDSNKYYVKFSPKKGSIESSSFDFINNKKPDFIIYNEFSINKDMGSSGSKLSMVSEINSHHFGKFIDIHELKKKIQKM